MYADVITNGTIRAIDNYLASKELYFYIYDKFKINYRNKIYNINFVISNKIEADKKIIPTNITMTDFIKIYGNTYYKCEEILSYKKRITDTNRAAVPKLSLPVFDFLGIFFKHFKTHINKQPDPEKIIFFDNPISINAQSSNNRTGYGSEYYYGTLVYEGTKYGETDQFPLVGYTITFDDLMTKYYKYGWIH